MYQHQGRGDTYFNLGLSHANEPLQWLQQCQSQSSSNGTLHKLQWYTHQHIKFVEHRKYGRFFSPQHLFPIVVRCPLCHCFMIRCNENTKLLCINMTTKHNLFVHHCQVGLGRRTSDYIVGSIRFVFWLLNFNHCL